MARREFDVEHKQYGRYSKSRFDNDDEEEGEIIEEEDDQYLGTNYERWHRGSRSSRYDRFTMDSHVEYDDLRKRRKVGDRIEHGCRDIWERDVERVKNGIRRHIQEKELEKERKRHGGKDVRERGVKRGMATETFVQPQSEVPEKKENASLPIDKLPEHSSLTISAVPKLFDSRDGGPDVDGPDLKFSEGKSPVQNRTSVSEKTQGAEGLDGGALKGKGDGLQVERNGPNDNWDDKYGHYKCEPGDILGSRYKVTAIHGSGVSSTVVCAKDLKAGKDDPEVVAIKVVHNNGTLNRGGQLELAILKKLAAADPKDRWHCVRLLSSSKHRNHLCLVLELLHMSLRDVIKEFGRKTRSTGLS
ncbi:hypothetical protein MKX01_019843 [Papaver californicum]|nr:hypothetical protein MKX01_019843 [Papaver californicum]